MQHKKRKATRLRGSETHGKGTGKKHRGSGSRGGRGMAGSGKRSEAKLMKMTGGKRHLGKVGFVSRKADGVKVNTITVATLQRNLDSMLRESEITKEKDLYVIDLTKLGYDKLLSKGNVTEKLKITVDSASAGVIEKVKEAGGEVVLPRE